MVRKTLKWFLRILALLLIGVAIFLVNLIWFRPWSLNLFYDRVLVKVLFEEPELLSSIGLVEQFGFTAHNGRLGDESPAHQQRFFDRANLDLADLRAYSVDRQTPTQKLSTHILDWFLSREVEGQQYQWHNYPVNQLFGVQNDFPTFMANTHRLLLRETAIITCNVSARFRPSLINCSTGCGCEKRRGSCRHDSSSMKS